MRPADHSCYVADPAAGCDDPTCCETVCQIDPFCCDNAWDALCVERAVQVCAPPPCPIDTDLPCDEPSVFPGCADHDCCGIVCEVLPLCCDVEWFPQCAALAETLCDLPAP